MHLKPNKDRINARKATRKGSRAFAKYVYAFNLFWFPHMERGTTSIRMNEIGFGDSFITIFMICQLDAAASHVFIGIHFYVKIVFGTTFVQVLTSISFLKTLLNCYATRWWPSSSPIQCNIKLTQKSRLYFFPCHIHELQLFAFINS